MSSLAVRKVTLVAVNANEHFVRSGSGTALRRILPDFRYKIKASSSKKRL